MTHRFYKLSILLVFILAFEIKVSVAETIELNQQEINVLKSLSLNALRPPLNSPSNQYSDNQNAVALGKQLFFDKRLSGDGSLACASCHQPSRAFTDGLTRAQGVNRVGRNTQTLIGLAWQHWFYWDGRRDTLWSQALVPFEAPDEMGSSRIAVLRTVLSDKELYAAYRDLFGKLPLHILNTLPEGHAGPLGNSAAQQAWYMISADKKIEVNKAYVNIGKAIAAYIKTLKPNPTRFDRYIANLLSRKKETDDFGKKTTATADEIAGMRLFLHPTKTRCLQCHNGPLLTNGTFHNVGSGVFSGKQLDFGRSIGLQGVLIDEFNCMGKYSDAKPEDCTAIRFLNRSGHIPLEGAYKTPTLRELTKTGPYFHDGRFNNLREVIQHYISPPQKNGKHELVGAVLTDQEVNQLIAFLNMLSGESSYSQ